MADTAAPVIAEIKRDVQFEKGDFYRNRPEYEIKFIAKKAEWYMMHATLSLHSCTAGDDGSVQNDVWYNKKPVTFDLGDESNAASQTLYLQQGEGRLRLWLQRNINVSIMNVKIIIPFD